MEAEVSICKIFSADTATEENVLNCGSEVKKSKLVIESPLGLFMLFTGTPHLSSALR